MDRPFATRVAADDIATAFGLLTAQFRGWTISAGELGTAQAYAESADRCHRWLHVEDSPQELASWLRAVGAPPREWRACASPSAPVSRA